jgi:hypothetical protein
MDKGTHAAVWLNDEGARLFLGAPQASRASRWLARGLVASPEPPVGFWLSVDSIQELRADGRKVDWAAVPPLCLIRWEYVITVQTLDAKMSDVGFSIKAPAVAGAPVAQALIA